jgi:predicted O-methyltransferase YrrM
MSPSNDASPDLTFRHLRLAPAPLIAEYEANVVLWRMFGDDAFAEMIASNPESLAHMNGSEHAAPAGPWVLYHSWLPGRVAVSDDQAAALQEALTSGGEDSLRSAHPSLVEDLVSRGWCDDAEVDLDSLVDRTKEFVAIQNRYELRQFLELVNASKPRTLLEIGTARGGTLYSLSQVADPSATLISIDLPGAGNGAQTERERELFATFGPATQAFHFISGDSHDAGTLQEVERILSGRGLDLLFIDGDHSYEGVKADFELYSGLMSETGIVALHDICMRPEEWGTGAEVGVYWDELSASRATREIVDPEGTTHRVSEGLRRPAWGIGMVEP